jgi:hypothetical protein
LIKDTRIQDVLGNAHSCILKLFGETSFFCIKTKHLKGPI